MTGVASLVLATLVSCARVGSALRASHYNIVGGIALDASVSGQSWKPSGRCAKDLDRTSSSVSKYEAHQQVSHIKSCMNDEACSQEFQTYLDKNGPGFTTKTPTDISLTCAVKLGRCVDEWDSERQKDDAVDMYEAFCRESEWYMCSVGGHKMCIPASCDMDKFQATAKEEGTPMECASSESFISPDSSGSVQRWSPSGQCAKELDQTSSLVSNYEAKKQINHINSCMNDEVCSQEFQTYLDKNGPGFTTKTPTDISLTCAVKLRRCVDEWDSERQKDDAVDMYKAFCKESEWHMCSVGGHKMCIPASCDMDRFQTTAKEEGTPMECS